MRKLSDHWPCCVDEEKAKKPTEQELIKQGLTIKSPLNTLLKESTNIRGYKTPEGMEEY